MEQLVTFRDQTNVFSLFTESNQGAMLNASKQTTTTKRGSTDDDLP